MTTRLTVSISAPAIRPTASWPHSSAAKPPICSRTVPDFAYLICKLMLDPDVPSSRKLDLGLALLYVLSPLDLVPDSVPLLGKLDDAYAIAVSVAKLLRGTERDVILRHWLGEPETIDSVRAWLDYFDNKLGSGLMKKVMHTLRRA